MRYRIYVSMIIISSFLFSCKDNGTTIIPEVEKIDTLQICNQVWMKKNLDVDHYRNGDSIPEVRDSIQWANLTTGAWCYYNNDPANGAIYGKLYNWYAANDPRGLAPNGWHIPNISEWMQIDTCIGNSDSIAGKLKEVGTSHWNSPNLDATNEFGFTALPNGFRGYDGSFSGLGITANWLSTIGSDYEYVHGRAIGVNNKGFFYSYNSKKNGQAVRCVKD